MAYLALISAVSVHLAVKKKLNVFYLLVTFMILHVVYGIGTLWGLTKISVFRSEKKHRGYNEYKKNNL